MLPERSQFTSQSAYAPRRSMSGRAQIAAMMTGERLGVAGHEPRHGIAYVSSSIEALENDPK